MLLYTKLAAPKAPKKRSRAGCTYCKEKKKKCDEERPACSRCAERGQDCSYEAVRPRQRKKRESSAGSSLETESQSNSHRPRRPTLLLDAASDHSFGRSSDRIDFSAYDADAPVIDEIETLDWPAATPGTELVSPIDMPFDLALNDNNDKNHNNNNNHHNNDADTDVDEEIVRTNPIQDLVVTRAHRNYPDLAMISPAPLGSPHLEFVMPAFSEFSDCSSRRQLVDHFANVLSHLIVLRETESGNPFQQLLLPLCYSSTTVQNAIYALSSAHLERRRIDNGEEKSLHFHNQAIQGLARLIEMGAKADREELLAAIMLLVYYEVLVQRGRSNIVEGHLKGAMTIMSQNNQTSTPTSAFLERAFRFYDVIAALSFGKSPISTAPAAGRLMPAVPLDHSDPSSSNIDTLLGLSTTLWPILHRLPNLLSVRKELEAALASPSPSTAKLAVLRTEFQTTADAIRSALENWRPILPAGLDMKDLEIADPAGGDGTRLDPELAHLQSILHNALAYRHSAFVYLFRSIHGHPRRHHLVQLHTRTSLAHCMATVSHSGTMAALLWPLFVAACEAVEPEDRDMARQVFAAIDKHQGMTNIERSWVIVQEVWRRSDFLDAGGSGHLSDSPSQQPGLGVGVGDDLWRRVSEDMGVTIVFG